MKLSDLVGKRVRLLQDECWAAHKGFVLAGNCGVVKSSNAGGVLPLIHIEFDRVKPREGMYFGIGCGDWEYTTGRQKTFQIIEENDNDAQV